MNGQPSALLRKMVRRSVESQMNSQISILRGSISQMDPQTGEVSGLTNATTVYEGKARVHTVNGGGSVDSSGGPIEERSAIISIPIDSPMIYRDDVIVVHSTGLDSDGSQSDTDLDTRAFRALDVEGGSYFGDARRISASSVFQSRYWGQP